MRVVTTTVLAACVLASQAQAQFNAIWGVGPNDVWAVGDDGMAAHFTGQGWVSMQTGTSNDLRDVWASGSRDVWAVGDNGTIMRSNGSAWRYERPLVQRHFIAVRGCGPNDVYVLGQSGEMGQPPALLHYNGSSWTMELTPFAFRPAGLSLVCGGVSGSGSGGLTMAGTAYYDPTPQQRRSVGVLLRRSGSSWTTLGYDGRTISDPQISNVAWTSIAVAAGAMLLSGQDMQGTPAMLLGRGSTWTSLPLPTVADVEPDAFRFTLAGDGTPIAVFPTGLARYAGGRWAVLSGNTTAGQMSAADQADYVQLAQQIGAMAQRGQQPTQQQLERFQQLSEQMTSATTGMASAVSRAQSLAFGRNPVVYAPTAANIFVASHGVFRITGDSSEVVWSAACIHAQMTAMEPCSNHAARGAAEPAAATGPQPEAPPEAAAPAAAPPPAAPRMPSVPRPRIPRP